MLNIFKNCLKIVVLLDIISTISQVGALCSRKIETCLKEKVVLGENNECKSDCDCFGSRKCLNISNEYSTCIGNSENCVYPCSITHLYKEYVASCDLNYQTFWKEWMINDEKDFSGIHEISPLNNLFLVASNDGKVYSYSLDNGEKLWEIDSGSGESVYYIKCLELRKIVATSDVGGIKLWSIESQNLITYLNFLGNILWIDEYGSDNVIVFAFVSQGQKIEFAIWNTRAYEKKIYPEDIQLADLIESNRNSHDISFIENFKQQNEIKITKRSSTKIILKKKFTYSEENICCRNYYYVYSYSIDSDKAIQLISTPDENYERYPHLEFDQFTLNYLTNEIWFYRKGFLGKAYINSLETIIEVKLKDFISIDNSIKLENWTDFVFWRFSSQGNLFYLEKDHLVENNNLYFILNLLNSSVYLNKNKLFYTNLLEYNCGVCFNNFCSSNQFFKVDDKTCTSSCLSTFITEYFSRTCLPCKDGFYLKTSETSSKLFCEICRFPCITCEKGPDLCTSCGRGYDLFADNNLCFRTIKSRENCSISKNCSSPKLVYVSSIRNCQADPKKSCDGSSIENSFKNLSEVLTALSEDLYVKVIAENDINFLMVLYLEGNIQSGIEESAGNPIIFFAEWSIVNIIIIPFNRSTITTLIFEGKFSFNSLQINRGYLIIDGISFVETDTRTNYNSNISPYPFFKLNALGSIKIYFRNIVAVRDGKTFFNSLLSAFARTFIFHETTNEIANTDIEINFENFTLNNFNYFQRLVALKGKDMDLIIIKFKKFKAINIQSTQEDYKNVVWSFTFSHVSIIANEFSLTDSSFFIHGEESCVFDMENINLKITYSSSANAFIYPEIFKFTSNNIVLMFNLQISDSYFVSSGPNVGDEFQKKLSLDYIDSVTFEYLSETLPSTQSLFHLYKNNTFQLKSCLINNITLVRKDIYSFAFLHFTKGNYIIIKDIFIEKIILEDADSKGAFLSLLLFLNENKIIFEKLQISDLKTQGLKGACLLFNFFYNNSIEAFDLKFGFVYLLREEKDKPNLKFEKKNIIDMPLSESIIPAFSEILSYSTIMIYWLKNTLHLKEANYQYCSCRTSCLLFAIQENVLRIEKIKTNFLVTDYLNAGMTLMYNNYLKIDDSSLSSTISEFSCLLFLDKNIVLVNNMKAYDNNNQMWLGGFIGLFSENYLYLNNCSVISSVTEVEGGVFGLFQKNMLYIETCEFQTIYSMRYGGGLASAKILNVIYLKNIKVLVVTSSYGGVVKLNLKNEIYINAANFYYIITPVQGGIFYSDNDNIFFINNTFIGLIISPTICYFTRRMTIWMNEIIHDGSEFSGDFFKGTYIYEAIFMISKAFLFSFTKVTHMFFIDNFFDPKSIIYFKDSEIIKFLGLMFMDNRFTSTIIQNVNFQNITLATDVFFKFSFNNYVLLDNCTLSNFIVKKINTEIFFLGESGSIFMNRTLISNIYFIFTRTLFFNVANKYNYLIFSDSYLSGVLENLGKALNSLFPDFFDYTDINLKICRISSGLCDLYKLNMEKIKTSSNQMKENEEDYLFNSLFPGGSVFSLISIKGAKNRIIIINVKINLTYLDRDQEAAQKLSHLVTISNINSDNAFLVDKSLLTLKNLSCFMYLTGASSNLTINDTILSDNNLKASLIYSSGDSNRIIFYKSSFTNNLIVEGYPLIKVKNADMLTLQKLFYSIQEFSIQNDNFLSVKSSYSVSIIKSHFTFCKIKYNLQKFTQPGLININYVTLFVFERSILMCYKTQADFSPIEINQTQTLIKYSGFYFNQNRAGPGGVLRYRGDTKLTCEYNNFLYNKATFGGTFAFPASLQFSISKNNFINNEASKMLLKNVTYFSDDFSKYYSFDTWPAGSLIYMNNSLPPNKYSFKSNKISRRDIMTKPILHVVHKSAAAMEILDNRFTRTVSPIKLTNQSADIQKIIFYILKEEKFSNIFKGSFNKNLYSPNCTLFIYGLDEQNDIQLSLPFLKELSFSIKEHGFNDGYFFLDFNTSDEKAYTCNKELGIRNSSLVWNKLAYSLEIIYPKNKSDIIEEEKVSSFIVLKDFEAVLAPCDIGESLIGTSGLCEPCPRDQFSNDKNLSGISLCQLCGDKEPFYCLGANVKIPRFSFWQPYPYSEYFYKCPKAENCNGDYLYKISEEWNIEQIRNYILEYNYSYSKIFCKYGYKGALCAECDGFRGVGQDYLCYECGDWRVYVKQLAMIIIKIILIWFSIKKAMLVSIQMASQNGRLGEKDTNRIKGGYLLRIFLEHYQHIMYLSFLPLKIPEGWREFFSFAITSASNDIKQVFSLECFLKIIGLSDVIKTWIFNILMIFLFNIIMFFVIAKTLKKLSLSKKNQRARMSISSYPLRKIIRKKFNFIMTYIFLTNIIGQAEPLLKSFFCKSLGDKGISRLITDFSLDCDDLGLTLTRWLLSFPILLYILIGLPLRLFTHLWKYRDNLKAKIILRNYGYFYIPFRKNRYFFELAFIAKRFIFLCLQIYQDQVIVSNEGEGAYVNLIFVYFIYLFIYFIAFSLLRPYNKKYFRYLNIMEKLSLNVLLMTCFSIILWWIAKEAFFNAMVIIVGGFNLAFFVWWAINYFLVKKQKLYYYMECLNRFWEKLKKKLGHSIKSTVIFLKKNNKESNHESKEEIENEEIQSQNDHAIPFVFSTRNLINQYERNLAEIMSELLYLQNKYMLTDKETEDFAEELSPEEDNSSMSLELVEKVKPLRGTDILKLTISGTDLHLINFHKYQNNFVCVQNPLNSEIIEIFLKVTNIIRFSLKELQNFKLLYSQGNTFKLMNVTIPIDDIFTIEERKKPDFLESNSKEFLLKIPLLYEEPIHFIKYSTMTENLTEILISEFVDKKAFSTKHNRFFLEFIKRNIK